MDMVYLIAIVVIVFLMCYYIMNKFIYFNSKGYK